MREVLFLLGVLTLLASYVPMAYSLYREGRGSMPGRKEADRLMGLWGALIVLAGVLLLAALAY